MASNRDSETISELPSPPFAQTGKPEQSKYLIELPS